MHGSAGRRALPVRRAHPTARRCFGQPSVRQCSLGCHAVRNAVHHKPSKSSTLDVVTFHAHPTAQTTASTLMPALEPRRDPSTTAAHVATDVSQPQRLAGAIPPLSLAVAVAIGFSLLMPGSGHCSEAMSGDALSAFKSFLDYVEASGPQGTALFLVVVVLMEMVPLLPTQPFSISSGLLFGGVKGTILVIVGMCLAAMGAFTISRGIGRKLAERVIVMETEDHGPVAAKLAEVQHTIRSGGPWQHLTAVTLLRLTPVVPFSAANYVLGLTPVGVPAYLGGTFIGATVWGVVYATLGAASRELLDSGVDIAVLFEDLAEKAGKYSSVALNATGVVALVAIGVYAATTLLKQQQQQQQDDTEGESASSPDVPSRTIDKSVSEDVEVPAVRVKETALRK